MSLGGPRRKKGPEDRCEGGTGADRVPDSDERGNEEVRSSGADDKGEDFCEGRGLETSRVR